MISINVYFWESLDLKMAVCTSDHLKIRQKKVGNPWAIKGILTERMGPGIIQLQLLRGVLN